MKTEEHHPDDGFSFRDDNGPLDSGVLNRPLVEKY
jgi:hypothetical protein